ncbi:SufE family protein [Basfia succiniciproducens]|uniref:SufE family protein n=1 Tax=Basfia succiniciproducens TaxID=653940 RepID=UPI003FCEA216
MNLQEQLKNAKNWEERYRLIIQAGKNITKPTEQELAEMQPLSGCEAQVWFKISQNSDRTLHFQAYSDARIINGLLWILSLAVNGKPTEQCRRFDLTAYYAELGIAQRLTSTRLNGLKQIEGFIHQAGN